MTAERIALLVSVATALFCSMASFYWQRAQKKADRKVLGRAEARKRESHLLLEIQMASGQLSYVMALAMKNKHTNGEVEEAIGAFLTAQSNYTEFLREQTAEHLR